MEIVESEAAGHPLYTLAAGEDVVVVSAFGAQILSWTKSGIPIIFENRERAIVDGKTPYRGGAPICFPYFAKGTLLPLGTTQNPMHGKARTTVWQRTEGSANELILTTSQPAAEGYGPSDLSCELSFSLSDALNLRAFIRNDGATAAPFQFAVHTYWATALPTTAVIDGLGNRYLDNLLGFTEQVESESNVPHTTPIDRVYVDASADLELVTESFRLQLSTLGCSGAVVWNPGIHHDLKDVASPDFICLESGQIAPPITLGAGDEHRLEVSYRASLLNP